MKNIVLWKQYLPTFSSNVWIHGTIFVKLVPACILILRLRTTKITTTYCFNL
jgi:hypothetical protein